MNFLRKWVTPFTIGAFLLMAVTGVLMFFHKDTGFNKLAHQWFSFAFVAGVVLHVATNWLAFSRYFKSSLALTVMALLAVGLGATFVQIGPKTEPPMRAITAQLGDTPLSELAPLVHTTPDALAARLQAKGYAVTNAQQTPVDLAGGDRKKASDVLGVIFAPSGGQNGRGGQGGHKHGGQVRGQD